jgi:hypothetical protein
MKTYCSFLLGFCLLFAGCVAVEHSGGIEPVDPKPSGQSGYGKAGTLQPTLVWRAAGDNVGANATYDLVIYEGLWATLEAGAGTVAPQVLRPGKEVYYLENLTGTSHTVEKRLIPYSYYCWTVRTRTGTNVSQWVTWSRQKLLGGEQGIYWAFKTPGPEAK